jgi:hypothetical protein
MIFYTCKRKKKDAVDKAKEKILRNITEKKNFAKKTKIINRID